MKRIYLDQPLAAGQTTTLSDATFHYVVRVLRCRDGERITVFNGDGQDYSAVVELLGKKAASVRVASGVEKQSESPLHTILIQGLSKGERMDVVMQKAVELGVNEIYPVFTEFCAVQLDGARLQKKRQHWQSVMVAACEQSQRAAIPTLHPLQPLASALATIHAEKKWVLHPYEQPNLPAEKASHRPKSLAIAVGPEGGFSESELAAFVAADFQPRVLGRRILRTETAAIVALAVAQQQWGDFDV